MVKLLLYLFVIPLVVYAMDSVNINGIFKKGQSNYYQARVMYIFLVMALSYNIVQFINDFLGVFR
ncbi:MAG: hypothetical protein PUD25_01720 [Bacilli bacterium]|nr:hypothetical protein [Bacilli bacterium]